MATVAILPIKSFTEAKQRLARELGTEFRRTLAEAMFADVLMALGRTAALDAVLVVSVDPRARQIASEYGATVLADQEVGHNAAARVGIGWAATRRAERALLVPGDCPLLDPQEIVDLIGRATGQRPSAMIVPDRHRTGTNALLLSPPGALAPSFGPGSCERHAANARADGVAHQVVQLRSLALDVDTPEDLVELRTALAAAEGGADHTRGVLGERSQSRV